MANVKVIDLVAKTTPVDADVTLIIDSAAANDNKKVTFANIKAFIKTYTDTLYPSGSGTVSGTNTGDGAVNSLYSGLVSNATHTGDAAGATALTLATVNANVGSFGVAASVSQFTVNAKGLITAAANVAISVTASQVSDFAATVRATALTGLSLISTTVISATDTVLVALGSLQAQITALTTVVGTKVASVTAGTNITVTGTATAPIVNAPTMTASVGGAVPTPPNNTTTFLRGDGTFATPAGSGDMVLASTQTNSGLKTFLDATFGLRNVANTFTGLFTNTITAARTWTLKDASGTLAFVSDITGTNSGTNTGDQTVTNTSDATSHTVTLSASGGSVQLVEGSGITLTTSGTGAAGVVTVAATAGGGGTVTATAGSLTANALVLGAGTTDTKVVTGVTTDGISQLNLGVNVTTLGKLKMFGNTSGDVTIQPNAVAGTGVVLTAPATTGTLALTSQITGTNSGTNTGDQTITLTGGVTGSGTGSFAATVITNANLTGDVTSTGNATTIAAGVVTLAKMANLAQDQFIGRITATTGVPETATITAAARTVLDDVTVAAMVDTLGGAASTGTGGLARATSPTFVTPLLGTPTSGVMTNVTGTATGLTSGITNALKSATTTVDVSAATAPTSGQVLTATAGTTATWQTPSGGSGTTWTEVTGTSQTASVSNGYVTNNAALVTVTLPTTASVGQIVYVQGSGAGGWRLGQNASQTVVWDAGAVAGTNITTAGTGGHISSSDRYDSIEVQCITTNTGWVVRNSKGNLSLV